MLFLTFSLKKLLFLFNFKWNHNFQKAIFLKIVQRFNKNAIGEEIKHVDKRKKALNNTTCYVQASFYKTKHPSVTSVKSKVSFEFIFCQPIHMKLVAVKNWQGAFPIKNQYLYQPSISAIFKDRVGSKGQKNSRLATHGSDYNFWLAIFRIFISLPPSRSSNVPARRADALELWASLTSKFGLCGHICQ